MDKSFNGRNLDKYPITFIPLPSYVTLPNGELFLEEWKYVHDYYPTMKKYYAISNMGRLFHIYGNTFLNMQVNMNGYWQKKFTFEDGSGRSMTIHRIVMNCFKPNPDSDKLEINHIDGNKLNNCILNLEWCTRQENIIHAMRTGLNPSPKLDEPTVHKICSLMQDPTLKLVDISKITGVPCMYIEEISQGVAYKYISQNYNIIYKRRVNCFSDEEMHALCAYFQANKKSDDETQKSYVIRALESIGYYNCPDSKIKCAASIYHREHFTNISSNYTF